MSPAPATRWGSALAVALSLAGPAAAAKERAPTDAEVLAELTTIAAAIEEGIRTGDKDAVARLTTDDMLLVNRDGVAYDKKGLIDDLVPPRPGYDLQFTIVEPRLVRRGDAAVYTFLLDEHLVIYGHDVSTTYRCNFVFFQEPDGWKLGLFEYFEKPVDPTPVALDPATLDRYVGTYEIAPGAWTTRVFRDGDRLMSQRGDRPPVPLHPIDDRGRFYWAGVEGELAFDHDAEGRVVGARFRRNNKDLPYRRVD